MSFNFRTYDGQLVTSNDVILFNVYKNANNKKVRDNLSFLASLWPKLFPAVLEDGVIRYEFNPYSHVTVGTSAYKAIRVFEQLIAEDVELLVDESKQEGHTLEQFTEKISDLHQEVNHLFGTLFYLTKGLEIVKQNPEVFYQN